ncbi:hypothetical protein BDB00DRAFT_935164 [Zychaea mexicana]|uniref:uncharacterized protein n=1 Tax=Zychaea mexicana TaxID=64656 RepID=UPI0022FED804|nr:uncharacterized protein BDB00DRAFT_935164 [Zychaea mexicana]KAI9498896.1 hypothetical protein BDB00DRAFT_935164 [Zychaea mexicana]
MLTTVPFLLTNFMEHGQLLYVPYFLQSWVLLLRIKSAMKIKSNLQMTGKCVRLKVSRYPSQIMFLNMPTLNTEPFASFCDDSGETSVATDRVFCSYKALAPVTVFAICDLPLVKYRASSTATSALDGYACQFWPKHSLSSKISVTKSNCNRLSTYQVSGRNTGTISDL